MGIRKAVQDAGQSISAAVLFAGAAAILAAIALIVALRR